MTSIHHDSSGRVVTLSEVTDENWREVADVAPRDDQRSFVAALAARYLLLSDRSGVWHSRAVTADGQVVGHVMWGEDADAGTHWIGGMVIDASHQQSGIGRAALRSIVDLLRTEQGAREVRLSVHPENVEGIGLYLSEGFADTGEVEDGEVVMALTVDPAVSV